MIDFRRYTLANGLRVIHSYDPSVSMAAVDVLYDTGARDESRSLTGIAHLFEHLMFGGSANVADFDIEMSNAGGRTNAWTSSDFTNFYDVLPAVNVETAMRLESDRMLALSFSPEGLRVQQQVVIEEFKQTCLNAPYGELMHHLRRAAYAPGHPYSWPVIGLKPEHVAAVTVDDIRRWFYAHYAPDNAVLAIAGAVSYDRGRELAEKWFGDIPRRNPAPRPVIDPGFPTQTVRIEAHGNAPVPCVVVAVPMDAYGTTDYRAADCITDILSAGRSSRIYRDLVVGGDGSVINADASVIGSEDAGLLLMTARLSEGADPQAAIEALVGELDALGGSRPVTPHELERTLTSFETTFALSNLDIAARAFSLALAEMHGENINETVARQRLITAADISRVAAGLAARPRVELIYTAG